jgi:hypothetical protein
MVADMHMVLGLGMQKDAALENPIALQLICHAGPSMRSRALAQSAFGLVGEVLIGRHSVKR